MKDEPKKVSTRVHVFEALSIAVLFIAVIIVATRQPIQEHAWSFFHRDKPLGMRGTCEKNWKPKVIIESTLGKTKIICHYEPEQKK